MIDVTQETPSPRMDPDVLALAAFHAGDRGAGLRLFERHVRPVRRYFLNKVRQDGDVDDLVHEVFQIMFNPESGFAAARSFGAYLFGVQQNVLRAYYRLRTDVAPTASVADFGASNSTWLKRQERCQPVLVACGACRSRSRKSSSSTTGRISPVRGSPCSSTYRVAPWRAGSGSPSRPCSRAWACAPNQPPTTRCCSRSINGPLTSLAGSAANAQPEPPLCASSRPTAQHLTAEQSCARVCGS